MAAVNETPIAVGAATEGSQAEQAPSAMEVSEEKAATEVAPVALEQQTEASEEKSEEPEAASDERAEDAMAANAPTASEEAAKVDASNEEALQEAPKTDVQADAEPKAMDVEEPAKEAQEQVEAATAAADASPEVAVVVEAQGVPKAEAQVEAQGEAQAATKATSGASAGAKRKRGSTSKEVPLEAMAGKIKRLQDEASEAEAEVVALVAEKAKMLAEIDARIANKRAEAEAKRVAADNSGKEYIKKQCEAALGQLESDVPKRPKNPYFLFSEETRQSDALKDCPFAEKSKKLAETWAALDKAGKQKYVDQFEAAKKVYAEWGSSEEGRKNISERNELLRKVKAAGMEELSSALAAVGSGSPAAQKSPAPVPKSPAKRTTEASAMETPPKQRRATPAKVEPALKAEPVLDDKVLAEATSADLLLQLRNLAARPEVLALGKTSQELLNVLKAKNGMVNAAKNALLSA